MLGSGRHAAGVAEITILFTIAAPASALGRDPFEVEYQLPAYQTGVLAPQFRSKIDPQVRLDCLHGIHARRQSFSRK